MKHKTLFRLPFNDAWFTFWGGDTKEQNKHFGIGAQSYAFDFIALDSDDKPHTGDGKRNDDYYSFGKDILAPAEGLVIEAVDGLRDNKPGTTNNYMLLGNCVLIKHGKNRFSVLAHLRNSSLSVKVGDKVTVGKKIGECGNSGNTSQPHLHYHLQDSDVFAKYDKELKIQEVAKGVKVFFNDIKVETDDKKEVKELHSPVRHELVSNAE